MRIGLISDTHGLLRPAVFDHFADVALILHAGDVGPASIITELETIAPVHAVVGNTDGWELRHQLPEVATLSIEARTFVVTHGHLLGSPTPDNLSAAFPNADIIVYGHTHRPLIDDTRGRLVINPGAAGPARFHLKPSIAILTLTPERAEVERIDLQA